MRARVYAQSSAVISRNGRFRYQLQRHWGTGPRAVVVMLNPSTADASTDDATLTRVVGLVEALGCGGVIVVNLYAHRATNPDDLAAAGYPAGLRNDAYLTEAAGVATSNQWPLIAAWGARAQTDRVARVLSLPGMTGLSCWGTTDKGHPRHPLYLPSGTPLIPWPIRGSRPAGVAS